MSDIPPLNKDWQSKMSVPKCFWHMLENQVACDVIFEVGLEYDRIGAHSIILMSRSSVFFKDFVAGLPEKEIEIVDSQPEEFRLFLQYLYCGEVNTEGFNNDAIMTLAEKYNVTGLVSHALSHQLSVMTVDKFCPFVRKYHDTHHMTDMIMFKCLEYVFNQSCAVFTCSGFTLLPLSFLKAVLQHDHFVLDEELICTCVLQWASKACEVQNIQVSGENQRVVLKDVIYLIRFPLLSQDYFTDKISENGLLTDAEEVHLLKFYLNPKKLFDAKFKFSSNKRIAPETPFTFNEESTSNQNEVTLPQLTNHILGRLPSNSSMPILNTSAIETQGSLSRFTAQAGTGWGYRGNKKDAIAFTASKDIKLDSVSVYGNCKTTSDIEIVLTIKNDKGSDLSVSEFKTSSQPTIPIHEVKVENETGSYGINIKANQEYHIVLSVKGDTGFYGKSGMSSKVVEGVEFHFKSSKYSTNNTTVNIGQIEGFKFTLLHA